MARFFHWPARALAGLTTLVLLAPAGAHAQTRAGDAALSADERAACLGEAPGAARSICLREVAAARASRRSADARVDQSPEALARNAVQRCQAFTDTQRRHICERMARGEGEVTGSVEAGGVLRSLETREPAPPVEVPLAPGVTVPAPVPAPLSPPSAAPPAR